MAELGLAQPQLVFLLWLFLYVSHFLIIYFRLKNEVDLILENMKKHVEHKNTLMMMNDALKRQVDLVKEECELKLKVRH